MCLQLAGGLPWVQKCDIHLTLWGQDYNATAEYLVFYVRHVFVLLQNQQSLLHFAALRNYMTIITKVGVSYIDPTLMMMRRKLTAFLTEVTRLSSLPVFEESLRIRLRSSCIHPCTIDFNTARAYICTFSSGSLKHPYLLECSLLRLKFTAANMQPQAARDSMMKSSEVTFSAVMVRQLSFQPGMYML